MNTCHDCGAKPGEFHLDGCDVERCPECGGQLLSCDCEELTVPRIKWDGIWPGVLECREFGWYCKWTSNGWQQCDKSDPEAKENLNRLCVDAVWDKNKARFVLK